MTAPTPESVVDLLHRFERLTGQEDVDATQHPIHEPAAFRRTWKGSHGGRLQILHGHLSRLPRP